MSDAIGPGRIVHVNLGSAESPVWRPAIVVSQHNPPGPEAGARDRRLTVGVFTDGEDDRARFGSLGVHVAEDLMPAVVTMRGVHEGGIPGAWRWPPRV